MCWDLASINGGAGDQSEAAAVERKRIWRGWSVASGHLNRGSSCTWDRRKGKNTWEEKVLHDGSIMANHVSSQEVMQVYPIGPTTKPI